MAGVKAKKTNGGARLETKWHAASCSGCGAAIPSLKEAVRLRWINLEKPRRSVMVWRHKKCTGA